MNNPDRIRAFAMRCDGASWEEIGEALHYTWGAVRHDLFSVVQRGGRSPNILDPRIRAYVVSNCNGSVNAFAAQLGVCQSHLSRVLARTARAGEALRNKVLDATGIDLDDGEA